MVALWIDMKTFRNKKKIIIRNFRDYFKLNHFQPLFLQYFVPLKKKWFSFIQGDRSSIFMGLIK